MLSFEPDYNCYKQCVGLCNVLKENEICIIQKGIWCKSEHLKLEIKDKGATRVIDWNEEMELDRLDEVDVVAVDDILNGKPCGFIKMDIEGSEYRALEGAKNTIRKDHPILAISIYHKPEDIVEIPEYILELSESYQFYIRHYSTDIGETVLYAL